MSETEKIKVNVHINAFIKINASNSKYIDYFDAVCQPIKRSLLYLYKKESIFKCMHYTSVEKAVNGK